MQANHTGASQSTAPRSKYREFQPPAGSDQLDTLFGTGDDAPDSWDLDDFDTSEFRQFDD